MRNVFFSFLGLGNTKPEAGPLGYRETVYELGGNFAKKTKFVQAAEMELLRNYGFDLILIAATQKSYNANFKELKKEMEQWGVSPVPMILEEDMTSEGQWQWFESLLARIEPNDVLTIDLTHGYRAVPIIFSAAVNFIQKARNTTLKAMYYGVWERTQELKYAPIIDMKDFYLINEWADAVGRLVDDADARKMAEVAEKTSEFQAGELNDPDMIQILDDLTNTIRNVDVNHISEKANAAIKLIEKRKQGASETGKILLDLVTDKFVQLTTRTAPSGKYDRDYFRVQAEVARLLLEHRLYMQAYTVMREFIASLVMIFFELEGMNNKKRKKRRPRYGDLFVHMFHFEESEWNFTGKEKELRRIKPFYEKLKEYGIEKRLRSFVKELSDYRNGFDHAWTAKSGVFKDISEKGDEYFCKLNEIQNVLDELIK